MSLYRLPALRRLAPSSSAGAVPSLLHRRAIWGVGPEERDSLIVPMPDSESPTPLFDGPTPTKVTMLENGIKVASSDLPAPGTTVGLYVETGSRYDSVPGTAHVLRHMAYKSSMGKSQLMMVRDTERIGASSSCTASRENMVYQLDTLKESVPEAIGLLAETTLKPKLLPWEISTTGAVISEELKDLEATPLALVQELMHPAAFCASSPLGSSLMAKPSTLPAIDSEVLGAFVSEQFVPGQMVLAAAGYEHEELVKLASAAFGSVPKSSGAVGTGDKYVGGETRISLEGPISHFALGFEGASWKAKSLVPMCVLNTLMGGGASFSAGGPGKGMYTRLYQNILNRYPFVQAASVFNAFYNETGIFGVYGAAPSQEMGSLVAAIVDECKKMAGPISDVELSRAKNQLKASLLMNLESRPILFEDIGRQVLTYGARTEPSELLKQIDAVTSADLNAVASALLKSPPSVVVYGDTTSVPRYDLIAKALA
jgi:processing peptidase subunit alpha